MASRVVIWLAWVCPWFCPLAGLALSWICSGILILALKYWFFSPETDANLFLALVCSSLLLPVHVWLFFLSQLALASRVPGKFRLLFFLFKSLFFLPLVYSEQVSGQNGVSGQPASLRLVSAAPWGWHSEPIRETPFPLLAKESFDTSTFFYHSLPHLSSGSRPLSPQMYPPAAWAPWGGRVRMPWSSSQLGTGNPMERRLVPSELPFLLSSMEKAQSL